MGLKSRLDRLEMLALGEDLSKEFGVPLPAVLEAMNEVRAVVPSYIAAYGVPYGDKVDLGPVVERLAATLHLDEKELVAEVERLAGRMG